MADQFPQGISERHRRDSSNRHVMWCRVGLIASVLVVALFGLLGGAPAPTNGAANAAASLAVTTPDRLRNGMLFETRVSALAKRPVGDAVIAIPEDMWRDMTINSMVPAPTEEEFAAGEFRLHFGPLDAGEHLAVKIDGQVNPPRYSSSSGRLRLLDGETELASLPVSLKVIP